MERKFNADQESNKNNTSKINILEVIETNLNLSNSHILQKITQRMRMINIMINALI